MIEYINDIEFDIADNSAISHIKKAFKKIGKINPKDINYIEISDKDGYVFIDKKGREDEWELKTIMICDELNKLGFDAFLSAEDYGYVDVIVINDIW